MTIMSKADVKAYKARWDFVNRHEIAETRRTSMTKKYRQFLELLSWARELNWSTSSIDADAVRERWRRLRKAYHGQKEGRETAT